MGYNSFTFQLAFRFILLLAFMYITMYVSIQEGFYVLVFVCTMVTLLIAYGLYRLIVSVKKDLLRYLDAIKYNDLNQSFSVSHQGLRFKEVELKLEEVFEKTKQVRNEQETRLKYLSTLTQHVPIPLISIRNDESVKLLNHTARKLFGSNSISKVDDLRRFGNEFYYWIKNIHAGDKKLIRFNLDGVERQLTVGASKIISGSQTERLISLQDINSELNNVQQKAWQDLVRVLTHEIMNSINPINSLAKTANRLISDIINDVNHLEDELSDINEAIKTISKRSDGLTHFVKSYRQLTLVPKPKKKVFKLIHLFERLETLFKDDLMKKTIRFDFSVYPREQSVFADPDLLEQVFINLIKNSEQAIEEKEAGFIKIEARTNNYGKILIEISDNGKGIPDNLLNEIFVPFFTTKENGSGVGLALTQQIISAHDGSISVKTSNEDGTTFLLNV